MVLRKYEVLWRSITSDIIEDMKITQETVQEKLKQVVSIPSSTPPIYQALMNCDTYLDTSQSIDVCKFWICKYVFLARDDKAFMF